MTNFVIAQNLGQDLCFREQFDVAVARAVAEMRILGNLENSISCFLHLSDSEQFVPGKFVLYVFFIFSGILSSSGSCGWVVCGRKGS